MDHRENPARGDVSFEYRGEQYFCRLTVEDMSLIEKKTGRKWNALTRDLASSDLSLNEMLMMVACTLWNRQGRAPENAARDIARGILDEFGDDALKDVIWGLVVRMRRKANSFKVEGGLRSLAEEEEHKDEERRKEIEAQWKAQHQNGHKEPAFLLESETALTNG